MPRSSIDILIEPRRRDLGGFEVGRVLPFAKRRMVGPFIFFDEMGPADFAPGTGIDVRPHPHIGLATVTYLLDGEMRHRDSLGFDQVIRPGDVNLMIAGRGIAHSERTDDHRRRNGQRMHGVQSWVALPESAAETYPAFHHHPKESLPLIETPGVTMHLILGEAFGAVSPARTFSPIFYLDVDAEENADIPLPDDHEERAIFVLDGAVSIDGDQVGRGVMAVISLNATPSIRASMRTRAMLLGGEALGRRFIWWNFVAASRDRIEQAKRDWLASSAAGFKDSAFTLPPGEEEFIPLPQD